MAKAPVLYLGTHMDGWLAHVGVPLFVSHRRLVRRKTLPMARSGWALDSGGFSELSMYGGWRTNTLEEYVVGSQSSWRNLTSIGEWWRIRHIKEKSLDRLSIRRAMKHLAVSRSPAISPVRFRRKTDELRESQ